MKLLHQATIVLIVSLALVPLARAQVQSSGMTNDSGENEISVYHQQDGGAGDSQRLDKSSLQVIGLSTWADDPSPAAIFIFSGRWRTCASQLKQSHSLSICWHCCFLRSKMPVFRKLLIEKYLITRGGGGTKVASPPLKWVLYQTLANQRASKLIFHSG